MPARERAVRLNIPSSRRWKNLRDQAVEWIATIAVTAAKLAGLGVSRIDSERCLLLRQRPIGVAEARITDRDAVVRVRGPNGERQIAFGDFHRLPGDTPERDTNLRPDELIIAVDLPAIPFAARSHYLKVRDRASYAFALVSVAAALALDSNKKIKDARLALGGVAHKPWRANAAEKKLIGQDANETTFRAAAEAELDAAKGYKYNSYKVELAKRSIVRALDVVAGMTS